MNITKSQGKAALKQLEAIAARGFGLIDHETQQALYALGWLNLDNDSSGEYLFDYEANGGLNRNQVMLALAMVATLAGVKP